MLVKIKKSGLGFEGMRVCLVKMSTASYDGQRKGLVSRVAADISGGDASSIAAWALAYDATVVAPQPAAHTTRFIFRLRVRRVVCSHTRGCCQMQQMTLALNARHASLFFFFLKLIYHTLHVDL